MVTQFRLPIDVGVTARLYHDSITASVNAKGCMDVDTVKGCTMGMADKEGGCYHECYAAKIANRYGIDFEHSIKRGFVDRWQHRDILVRQLRAHSATWYRIGVMGDPCHEAETELFFKAQGLTVYNKIIYLEAEFTRLAQAKKTLNFRKFPKREQRIIVAYNGDVEAIRDEFPPIGRL